MFSSGLEEKFSDGNVSCLLQCFCLRVIVMNEYHSFSENSERRIGFFIFQHGIQHV